MSMRLFVILLAVAGCARMPSTPKFTETQTPEAARVRAAMKETEAGKFRDMPLEAVSGWLMTIETGQVFHRAELQNQGEVIIPVGAEAVPELIKWLDHPSMHMRYIASYCLEQITGERPFFPHFATLKTLRSRGYLKGAVKCWSEWYAERMPNKITGANSRPGSPIEVARDFGYTSCAQPHLSAAVAQFCR